MTHPLALVPDETHALRVQNKTLLHNQERLAGSLRIAIEELEHLQSLHEIRGVPDLGKAGIIVTLCDLRSSLESHQKLMGDIG